MNIYIESFPPVETNRKILEDIQLKRQLLQKSVNTVADLSNLSGGINTNISQVKQHDCKEFLGLFQSKIISI